MKKVLLFLFLISVSLFAQGYVNSLYDAIKENNTKKIIEIANNYKVDLNNVFSARLEVSSGMESFSANISPLIYAIDCGNIAAIDTLLKLGAKLNGLTDIFSDMSFEFGGYDENRISITPLMYAAYRSSDIVVSFLIKKGAKVNAKDRYGKTALMYGPYSEVLIKAGADVNAKDNEGKTPLMYGPSEVLIKAGADVNAKDNDGQTVLMYAAYRSSDIVSFLIKKGAKVNAKDNGGRTPLMYGPSEVLIKAGADVNAKNNEGMTPLMYACLRTMIYYNGGATAISDIGIDIVKSLIRAGANINEVDKDGNSALLYLLYTIRSGIDSVFGIYETVEEYEEDSGASLFLELIKFLIDNGANVNIRNKEGETPLSLSKEFPKLTKFLKDNGAYLQ